MRLDASSGGPFCGIMVTDAPAYGKRLDYPVDHPAADERPAWGIVSGRLCKAAWLMAVKTTTTMVLLCQSYIGRADGCSLMSDGVGYLLVQLQATISDFPFSVLPSCAT